jgi:hypothetical protein
MGMTPPPEGGSLETGPNSDQLPHHEEDKDALTIYDVLNSRGILYSSPITYEGDPVLPEGTNRPFSNETEINRFYANKALSFEHFWITGSEAGGDLERPVLMILTRSHELTLSDLLELRDIDKRAFNDAIRKLNIDPDQFNGENTLNLNVRLKINSIHVQGTTAQTQLHIERGALEEAGKQRKEVDVGVVMFTDNLQVTVWQSGNVSIPSEIRGRVIEGLVVDPDTKYSEWPGGQAGYEEGALKRMFEEHNRTHGPDEHIDPSKLKATESEGEMGEYIAEWVLRQQGLRD